MNQIIPWNTPAYIQRIVTRNHEIEKAKKKLW